MITAVWSWSRLTGSNHADALCIFVKLSNVDKQWMKRTTTNSFCGLCSKPRHSTCIDKVEQESPRLIELHVCLIFLRSTGIGGKGNHASFIRRPVVDEERMRPGHWFGSVLWVSFSTWSLLAGWREGQPGVWNNWRKYKLKMNQLTQIYLENGC